jgi:hypothetical protein
MASVVAEPLVQEVKRAGIRGLLVDTHAPVVHRTLGQVLEIVSRAEAPAEARSMAGQVFHRIARAEEEIHGEHAHFHDVGADDAIAEVVGACTALLSLAPASVVVRPVSVGGGSAAGPHGLYPVPAPATLAILRDAGLPVTLGDAGDGELCTPTGAALLAEFASIGPGHPVTGKVTAVGYGAGSRDSPGAPNVLRAYLLETVPGGEEDCVDILETSVDDVTGEVLADAAARLMAAGARDVSLVPCTMKKGRPGYLVRVICLPGQSRSLAAALAVETGTLGIRCLSSVHRFTACREVRVVRVRIGEEERDMPVKCGAIGDAVFSVKAEFEDARKWAAALGMPVRQVARVVEEEAWRQIEKGRGP